jgi:hypothetical protein
LAENYGVHGFIVAVNRSIPSRSHIPFRQNGANFRIFKPISTKLKNTENFVLKNTFCVNRECNFSSLAKTIKIN